MGPAHLLWDTEVQPSLVVKRELLHEEITSLSLNYSARIALNHESLLTFLVALALHALVSSLLWSYGPEVFGE